MSNTHRVLNDPDMLHIQHCEGCNGQQMFREEDITLILIHGEIIYVYFFCQTCALQMWRPADSLRRELVSAGVTSRAMEIVASSPELQRGVWMVPIQFTHPPELITDSELEYFNSRF